MTAAQDRADAAVSAIVGEAQSGTDMGEWLAIMIARAAARLGSSQALLAARPGSWEAACVAGLLQGTVGAHDESLADYADGPS